MKKIKTIAILSLLALGFSVLLIWIITYFLHKAESTHRVLPEVRSLKYVLMLYFDEKTGLPADETQLIAHGYIRKTDDNIWQYSNGGNSIQEPIWYKLHFFEEISISYGLTPADLELSGDIVVDKVKKEPLLIINGPGSDKFQEFYQTQTFDLYNLMCKNFNWTYHHDYPDLEWTQLHEAIKNNNVKEVESLIKKGVDVNIKAPGLFIPLHVAATYGFVDIAKFLLDSGANINDQDSGGFSALHIAALNGHLDVVQLLIEKGADINLRTKAGRTAQDEAKIHAREDIFDFLSEKKLFYIDSISTLEWALMPIVDEDGKQRYNDELITKLANAQDVNATDENEQSILHRSIIGLDAFPAYKKIIPLFLEKGADVNAKDKNGYTPLDYTHKPIEREGWVYCEPKDKEIVDLLKSKGAEFGAGFFKPHKRSKISEENLLKKIEIAISKGHDIDKPLEITRGRPLLSYSLTFGYYKAAANLIDMGADVNLVDRAGYTPLQLAVIQNQKNIVKILLNKRANCNVRDTFGLSPISNAVFTKDIDIDIIRLLIEHGADIDIKNSLLDGSLLHKAVLIENKEICKILLKNKITIDVQDDRGNTPIHRAAKIGNKELVLMLLKYGAKANIKNVFGKTPFDIAANEEIKNILRQTTNNN